MNTAIAREHNGPGRMIFGPGSVNKLPEVLDTGKRVFLVTDPGLSKAGVLDTITNVLSDADLSFEVYDRVVPEAPLPSVEEAAAEFKKSGSNALLAVGGGSAIDTAKAIGLLVNNPGNFIEYAQGRTLENEIPYLAAVPTTAGTGSEVTDATVVTNPETNTKMVLRGGKILLPSIAILDPQLLGTLPSSAAAETGIDALSHAFEALASKMSQPFADALALQAIRLILQYLRPLAANPADLEAAQNMLIASNLAGQSFNNAGLGMVHGLAHPLGAHFHVSHGKACALYLVNVMKFNMKFCAEKYSLAALVMGCDVKGATELEAAAKAIETIEKLLDDLNLPRTYEQAGISFELKNEMVEQVMAMPARMINPRLAEHDEIEKLFSDPSQENYLS